MKTLTLIILTILLSFEACDENLIDKKDQMGFPKEITFESNGQQIITKGEKTPTEIAILDYFDNNKVLAEARRNDQGEIYIDCKYEWLSIEVYPKRPYELFIRTEPNDGDKDRRLLVKVSQYNHHAKINIIQKAKQQTTNQIYLIKEEH